MTKKQQQIILVAVVAVAVILALGWFFAVKPKMAERTANQEATVAATNEANGLKSTLAQLQAKQAGLEEAQAKVTELTTMFPNTFEQDQWFNTMRAAASRAGVTLTQVTPGIPTASTGGTTTDPNATPVAPPPVDPNAPAAAAGGDFLVAESAVTLNATGSTAGLAQFLTELEGLERPLLIDTISITFGDTEGGNEGTLAISGKTFLTRPMDPAPEIVTGVPTEETPETTDPSIDPSTEVDPSAETETVE